MSRNFSFIKDAHLRRYVEDAYQAVDKTETWNLMKEEPAEGFMFTNDPRYNVIHDHMQLLNEHSGSSYAIMMRHIQFIAQKGWDAYVAEFP